MMWVSFPTPTEPPGPWFWPVASSLEDLVSVGPVCVALSPCAALGLGGPCPSPLPSPSPTSHPCPARSLGAAPSRGLLRKRWAGADPGLGDRGPSGPVSALTGSGVRSHAGTCCVHLFFLLTSYLGPRCLSLGALQAGATTCLCLGHSTRKRFTSGPLFPLSKGISCDWKKK